MKIDVNVKQMVEVDLDINDIIDEINLMELIPRMSIISSLINGIEIDEDFEILTPKQKEIVILWLNKQLKKF